MKKLLLFLLLFFVVSIFLIKKPFSHDKKEIVTHEDEKNNNVTEVTETVVEKEDDEHIIYPDDVYDVLDFDRRLILNIGEQDDWGHCAIYCLAYSQAILYNRNGIDPYTYYDGSGAVWRWADYKDIALDNPLSKVLQLAYDEISKGIPVLFYVGDTYAKTAGHEEVERIASEHYVLLIGYRSNADYDSLKPSDFYGTDPSGGYKNNENAYVPWIILTDDSPKTINGEYALFTSDDTDLKVKVTKAYIDTIHWDDSGNDVIHPNYYLPQQ